MELNNYLKSSTRNRSNDKRDKLSDDNDSCNRTDSKLSNRSDKNDLIKLKSESQLEPK